jgi:hypothetical protein
LFRPLSSGSTFYFRHTNTEGIADNQFLLGDPVMLPVSGSFG